ncbi:MAG: glycosyltransferase [Chlorobi bacterium]|nr:glycosyltransferase [Chlorobiota bacterium]
MEQAVTYLFLVSFIIQLLYYFLIYRNVLRRDEEHENTGLLPPLTVIISAKNEAENLRNFLPLILNQSYSEFELIVVNDASTDGTKNILSEFQSSYNNLQVIEIKEEYSKGKKNALTKAVAAAKYEYLVFTDADCYPVSENWLKTIARLYSENIEIVLGYGAYKKQKGFLNKLIRFETLFNAMQYMSFAISGFPYMGVGRNLSYKKSVWIKNGGFLKHKNILSGDDDLFVNAAATKKNIKILTDAGSKTVSIPKNKFKDYLKQKKRHLSTGNYYKQIYKLLLGTEVFSRFLFYVGVIILLCIQKLVLTVILLYLMRIMIIFIFLKKFSDKINDKQNLFFISIFDILIPMLNLFVFTGTLFDKKIVWK